MRRQFFGFFIALVVTSVLAPSQAAAICAAPEPIVSMSVVDAPPECATVEAVAEGGDGYLEVVNACDVELRIERVNCSACSDDAVAPVPGETDRLQIPIGYDDQAAESDFRWSTAEASGMLTVRAQMPESKPCDDVRYTYENDSGCSTAAPGRGALPASFAILGLLALAAFLQRSRRRGRRVTRP